MSLGKSYEKAFHPGLQDMVESRPMRISRRSERHGKRLAKQAAKMLVKNVLDAPTHTGILPFTNPVITPEKMGMVELVANARLSEMGVDAEIKVYDGSRDIYDGVLPRVQFTRIQGVEQPQR